MRPPSVPRRRPAAALFLPPLAAFAALGSFAAHQRDPVAGAETAYLALLAAALLAAVAAVEAAGGGRRGGVVAPAAVLAALAGWAIPAGPLRVAAVLALAVAALALAVAAGEWRAHDPARGKPTIAGVLPIALPLALAFQVLVRAERLLAPEPGWRLFAGMVGLPLIAAVAAAFLAVRAGRAPAFAAAATAALLGPGFTLATSGALAALAGAEAAWRPGRAGGGRWLGLAAVGAGLAAVTAADPRVAVVVAAAALALGGGWAVVAAVGAAAIAAVTVPVSSAAGGGWSGGLALAMAAVAPSLVPLALAAVRWRDRRRLGTAAVLLLVAVAAARADLGVGALAAPLACLTLLAGGRRSVAGSVLLAGPAAAASRGGRSATAAGLATPAVRLAGAAGGGSGAPAALAASFAARAVEPIDPSPRRPTGGWRPEHAAPVAGARAPFDPSIPARTAEGSPAAGARGGAPGAVVAAAALAGPPRSSTAAEGPPGGAPDERLRVLARPGSVSAGAPAGDASSALLDDSPGAFDRRADDGRSPDPAGAALPGASDRSLFAPQWAWSAALVALAALAAAPPWLRAEPLAAALASFGADRGWAAVVAVAIVAALVPIAAAGLDRRRRVGRRGLAGPIPSAALPVAVARRAMAGAPAARAARHPGDHDPTSSAGPAAPSAGGGRGWRVPVRTATAAMLALAALFVAAVAALPSPAAVDLLAGPTALDAERPRLVLDLPAGSAAADAGLALVAETSLSHAVAVPAGAPVARVRLASAPPSAAWTLRAGVDTAEWAIRRPDVAAGAAHPAPPHALARVTGEGFFGLVFRSRGELAAPAGATRLVVERDPALPAEAVVHLHRLQVRR